jgi:beta-glucanase (GH16 family)
MLPVHGYPRGSGDPEIDIMEMLGDRPATIYQTTHAAYHAPGAQFRHTGIDASTGFHRYGARWTPSAITFYIDGQETGSAPNVFTQPMYLMANLQVGAPDSWPGAPDGATSFPATMTVAYIRAYQPTGACS